MSLGRDVGREGNYPQLGLSGWEQLRQNYVGRFGCDNREVNYFTSGVRDGRRENTHRCKVCAFSWAGSEVGWKIFVGERGKDPLGVLIESAGYM